MSERIYRALLRLYPADFRHRFGEDMVQLFSDKLRDARASRAPWGTAAAWLAMLGDVATTAASERLRRNRHVAHSMPTTPPIEARVLGLAGVVGGAVLLTAFVIDVPSGLNALRIALFNFGAIAVAIALLRRRDQPGLIPLIAGALLIGVSAWHAVMALANIHGDVLFATDVALWLATAGFGVIQLVQPGLSRWGALALSVGSALAVTGIDRLGLVSATSPTIFNSLSQAGIVMVGIGWVVMGIDVATRREVVQPVA
ncbi:MAG TPA: hypothetical protein VFH90_05200 [Candidatus Limnocylindria bacterium]|nr:hypothetical protein [Candidatus Limnocylindria bacterium]